MSDFRISHCKEKAKTTLTEKLRLLDQEKAEKLYRLLGDVCRKFKDWSYYAITSNENFQKEFDMKATKNRKLYNGGIKCYYYQYFGKKPRGTK